MQFDIIDNKQNQIKKRIISTPPTLFPFPQHKSSNHMCLCSNHTDQSGRGKSHWSIRVKHMADCSLWQHISGISSSRGQSPLSSTAEGPIDTLVPLCALGSGVHTHCKAPCALGSGVQDKTEVILISTPDILIHCPPSKNSKNSLSECWLLSLQLSALLCLLCY